MQTALSNPRPTKHSSAIVKYAQDSLAAACVAVQRGTHELTIEGAEIKERLSDVNIAGYMLLKSALAEMTPKEVSFAAQMYAFKFEKPSPKQAAWIRVLLDQYLGIELRSINPKDGRP